MKRKCETNPCARVSPSGPKLYSNAQGTEELGICFSTKQNLIFTQKSKSSENKMINIKPDPATT